MLNFICGIFNKQENNPVEIKTGSLWVLAGDIEDPFPQPKYPPVRVIDVKAGWVLYDMSLLKNQKLKIESFLNCYKPAEE